MTTNAISLTPPHTFPNISSGLLHAPQLVLDKKTLPAQAPIFGCILVPGQIFVFASKD